MLHIPKFDPEIADHLALASLSDTSHDIVAKHHFIKKGFKAMRNEALRILSENLKEIARAQSLCLVLVDLNPMLGTRQSFIMQ